jgi:hypothetical protein
MRIAAAAALVLMLTACSSGNNKKKANNTNAAPAAVTASAVAPISGAGTRTPTPAAARATATPALAAATPTRVVSPAALGTPARGAAADPALQQALMAAALQVSDLPAGYTSTGPVDTSNVNGVTASYTTPFLKLSLADLGLVVDSLFGFQDSATAQATLKDAVSQIQGAAGQAANLQLTPVNSSIKLGDQTQVYQVSVAQSGFNFTGYVIAWQRGRLDAAVAQAGAGASAPKSPEDVLPLAQTQDEKLKKVPQ